jgi:transcriptional antiterminator RfaH
VSEPLFPRYLFIRLGMEQSSQSWSPIRYTTGVSRLVSFGAEPAKVDEALIEGIQAQESRTQQNPSPLFNAGDRVRITDGAFAGIEGVFQMADGTQRVFVLIEMMSKPLSVGLGPALVRKIA